MGSMSNPVAFKEASMSTTLPSKRRGFRHLGFLSYPRPTDECEMGEEDGCDGRPAFWLTAPDSYVKPMILCAKHADDEAFYFGTAVPVR